MIELLSTAPPHLRGSCERVSRPRRRSCICVLQLAETAIVKRASSQGDVVVATRLALPLENVACEAFLVRQSARIGLISARDRF